MEMEAEAGRKFTASTSLVSVAETEMEAEAGRKFTASTSLGNGNGS